MKKLFFVCVVFFFTHQKSFAQQPVYSKINVSLEDNEQLNILIENGFDIDHAEQINNGISFFVSELELIRLQELNISYEITIPDYAIYYAQRVAEDAPNLVDLTRSERVANGFGLGSMGGFYTYTEVEAKLDEMKADYPNLITDKISIGTTAEGRTIWMAKISDNPDIDEPEPSAYFDALHHAREPLSMAVAMNYMFWLLENYETDPQVQYLVNNRELYFVPVVNPDGYEYNRQTDPNGGGLWRKNRNPDVGGGCVGVDLNRNYGYEFGHNNSCSSDQPCSGIYRGSGPFSEPESAAVRDLMAQIEPKTAFSMHSTAGTYLMPYGYDTTPPDFEIYSEWASAFLNENDYTYGVTFQMLGYTSCGTTRDYFHSEEIYGWTPEIDGNGFWPNPSTIFDLVAENIRPLFYQSWIAGAYLDVQSHKQIGLATPGESIQFVVEVKNVGVGATAENVSVIVSSNNPEITISTASGYGNIDARSRVDNAASPFTISLAPTFSQNSFTVNIATYQDGVLNESSDLRIFVGNKDVLFFDDSESGDFRWLASGNGIMWSSVTDDSYSGTSCFGDSNGGNGVNDTVNFFELDEIFDFTSTTYPTVHIMSKYSIESGDRVYFEISTDGGTNWIMLDEYHNNELWKHFSYDLSAFNGANDVRLRFQLNNNQNIPGDGFYFDDFEVADYDRAVLSVSETTELSELIIHPNPFKEQLFVSFPSEKIAKLDFYDLSGRTMPVQIDSTGETSELKGLGGIEGGIYFLKITDIDGTVIMKKLLKI
tara:strand:- start:140950 stop:143250 length:2301 start_codon:yes stop_codon:yes gene_type:complete